MRDITVFVGVGAVIVSIAVPDNTVCVEVVVTVTTTKLVILLVTDEVGATIVNETTLVTSVMVVVSVPSGPSRFSIARRTIASR